MAALILLAGLIGGGDYVITNLARETRVGVPSTQTADLRALWWAAVRPAASRPPPKPTPVHVDWVAEAGGRAVAPEADNGISSRRKLARSVVCVGAYPWGCDWALAVIDCESTYRAGAISTAVVDGVRYWFHGWWQIISTSPDPGPLADPVYNTEQAAWKYLNEGTGAWPGCP